MKNVLLIASLSERYYFEPFLNVYKNKDINIHICDPSRYPTKATMCAIQDKAGCIHGYIDTVLLQNGSVIESSISFSDIHIAWYLRENFNNLRNAISNNIESRFSNNETRQTLRAIFSTLQCKWVNKRESIECVNSNKFFQQSVAANCGLLVPKTIISNNHKEVYNFSDPKKGLLLKSVGYIKLDDDGKLALYSERFFNEELSSSSNAIQSCPVYGQEYIEKLYEYRVMVIGSNVLSCRIDSQASRKTMVDWRHYDFENVEHKCVQLPSQIQDKLRNFMIAVDLKYGAIDLIETHEKDFIFLEVNPSGQWGWIADIAGLPISNAVAEMLEVM